MHVSRTAQRNCLVRTSPLVLFLINSYRYCCWPWTLDSTTVDTISDLALHLCVSFQDFKFQSLSQRLWVVLRGPRTPHSLPAKYGEKEYLPSLDLYLWPSLLLVKWPAKYTACNSAHGTNFLLHGPLEPPACGGTAVEIHIWVMPTCGPCLKWNWMSGLMEP